MYLHDLQSWYQQAELYILGQKANSEWKLLEIDDKSRYMFPRNVQTQWNWWGGDVIYIFLVVEIVCAYTKWVA